MKRPKIKIELESIDIATEFIGVLALVVLIALPLYFYDQLPESIPKHFGADGNPDGFSGKWTIWTLPIVGLVMYIGMFWLNKYPHTFNYPQNVTMDNAKHLYTFGTKMIRTLNAITTLVFAYLTYTTIQTALGNQNGIGSWFTPIFMIVIMGTIGYLCINQCKHLKVNKCNT